MHVAFRLVLAAPVIVLTAIAGFQVSRTAFSQYLYRQDSIPALERAARIMPEDANIHARIAVLDASRNDNLQRAISLNPRQPSWWIMRAVRQEQDGDPAGAESSLLQATAVSRYYVPWWSLTAFYYRRGETGKFVRAARETLSVGAGDFRPVFQMARNLKLAEHTIQEDVLPLAGEVMDAYLRFALDENSLDAALATAPRLILVGSKANRGTLLAASETLLIRGRISEAIELWNGISQAGWTPMGALDPLSGRSLTDGVFKQERLQTAFDWKLLAPSTLPVTLAAATGLRIEFTGRQPEDCELLSQYVPLLPNRQYRLSTRYRTRGIPQNSGVRWAVVPVTGDGGTELENLASEQATAQNAAFETSSQEGAHRLILKYSRLPGLTRLVGHLWIESVSLDLLPVR